MKTKVEPKELDVKSVHTENFPLILQDLGISLVISTYQAGKLIILREKEGTLNNHFRLFNRPMGLAAQDNKLAVGSAYDILELHSLSAIAKKLDPQGKHDAYYLPRHSHTTGDIDIHEMAWGKEGLWLVNTRFSCLCNLGEHYSFIPRWAPNFISTLAAEDRCHLNGLAMADGSPKCVSALGATDEPGKWRENLDRGGVLIDVASGEVFLQGLSMPHSPRWYADKLWFLESGRGSLVTVDLAARTSETVIQLPGYTRGLAFYRNLAFIGLSQVRDTNMLEGIPFEERAGGRACGVWVVNINTGKTVAWMRFTGGVEEIFALQILPGIRFPEIAEWYTDWQDILIAESFVLPPLQRTDSKNKDEEQVKTIWF